MAVMFDLSILTVVAAIFVLAGMVKGIAGLGMPTVSLALLTVTLDMQTGMALLLVPTIVTNLWQACAGGQTRLVLRQIWSFLLLACLTVWLGVHTLTLVDPAYLAGLLGGLLVIYSSLNLAGFRLSLSPTQARWGGPVTGVVNGVITGMTGSCVVPGVVYLQAIGLPRDALIQAMGMLFTSSTLALALALQSNDLLTTDQTLLSTLALLPAVVGMWIGGRIRQQLSEAMFKRVFFIALLLLGLYILSTTLL